MEFRSPSKTYINPKREARGFYKGLHGLLNPEDPYRLWCLTDLDYSLLYQLVNVAMASFNSQYCAWRGEVLSEAVFTDEAMAQVKWEEPNRAGLG